MKQLTYKEIKTELPQVAVEGEVYALDTELAGLKDEQLHRPHGRLTSLAGTNDGETVYIIFGESEVQEFLNRIEKATWIFHNSTFDIGHLRRWANIPERKNMRDTMLIEKLMFANYYDDFGLNDLVRRYLKCYMPKDVRKEFSNLEGAMTQEQIEYAALDVVGTWLVDKEQQKIIEKKDKMLWDNLYNPHVWTALELGGFKLDVDAWVALADRNQQIVDEIEERLGNQYGTTAKKMVGRGKARHEVDVYVPFNPSSPAQVLKVLKSRGIDVESTGDDVIAPYYDKDPFVKDILDFRKADKQVSTYGLSFLKFVEADGRIYTSLNIAKAETGRDSSSSPNLQNQPSEKERRACFVAGKGMKLILYDYSGQEANIWAYVTQDPLFIDIINHGKKLYLEVARIAFNEEVVKGTPRYKIIKALVLGLMYGLTPWGFHRDNDVDLETAEEMYKQFFEAFPVSAAYIREKQSRNTGLSYSVLGRKCHLHPYNANWKNNSLNNPMQATGSDMIKIAMKKIRKSEIYQKLHPVGKMNLILQVHDEILVECAEEFAVEVDEIVKKCMIETAEKIHPGIKGGVSGGIINNWSEKD